jgi:pyridoxamine 5'-phosphate oxidase
MDQKIASLRREYTLRDLTRDSVNDNPVAEFKKWLNEAVNAKVNDPTSMILATAGSDGKPSARVVLLKDVTNRGLSFYGNYESKKGRQLAENPNAALVFFWPELERQVRFEGVTAVLSGKESDEYFNSRPEGSKAGAWASRQSTVIASRQVLENEVYKIVKLYQGRPIPRPPFWGGYRLIPVMAEFWQGRTDRLHDRIQYISREGDWEIVRLSP